MVYYYRNEPGWKPVLSFMRRWSAPFDRCNDNNSAATTLLGSTAAICVLAAAAAAAADDDDGKNLQPVCTAVRDNHNYITDTDSDDDEVFTTGWPE